MAEIIFLTTSTAPPMGLGQLAKSLSSHGIQSGLVSFGEKFNLLERKGQEDKHNRKVFAQEVEKELRRLNLGKKGVRFIGMPMYDSVDQKAEVEIARIVKRIYPKIKLIGGGPAFTSNPRGFFAQGKFDYAIRGEAEKALPKLINAIKQKRNVDDVEGLVYRKSGRIITKPITLLTQEEIQKETMPLSRIGAGAMTYTERGCPNACIFCTVPRKGKPVQLEIEEIIRGLKQLTKNPEIKVVSFMDDHLMHDRPRAIKLLRAINENGLNKKLKFATSISVDSLLKNGQPDGELLNWMKRAGIVRVFVGTEAFNNPMLAELKNGKYTKEQAVELNHAISRKGIWVEHYMLAGGIETRAKDFIESYYTLQKLRQRRFNSSNQIGLIQAIKGTKIYQTASKEGMLLDLRGRKAIPIRDRQIGKRFVSPKDPLLAQMIKENLKQKLTTLTSEDLDKVIKLAKAVGQTDSHAAQYVKRLLKVKAHTTLQNKFLDEAKAHFFVDMIERELKLRGLNYTQERAETLLQEKELKDRMLKHAESMAVAYLTHKRKIQKLKGTERLRSIQKMRHRLGQGMTLTVLRKK